MNGLNALKKDIDARLQRNSLRKQRGGVLITLNRPEALNAITRPMLKELHHALDEAEADPDIRAIVITGAGRAFSSGFDQTTTTGRRRDIQWPMAFRPA